jgi:hypothetical protein
MRIDFISKLRKGHTHSEWYLISEFIQKNPKLKHLTKKAPQIAPDDLGVVSKATAITLIDKTKKWKKDAYLGFPLWISRGKGEGQTRIVVSNTKNTLNLDKPWKEVPDASSQYVLSYNIHDPQVRGNVLPKVETKKRKKVVKSKRKAGAN